MSARGRESALQVLVEALAQATWETDSAGRVVEDSPSWRAYTGQSRDAWLGHGWLGAVHPDDRKNADREWAEAVAAGRPLNTEFRLRGPQGTWRWSELRTAPIRDTTGQVIKWVGMNIDITERERGENALREADQRKDEFLATLAHELRNPLAPLRTGLDLLQIHGGSDEQVLSMMTRQLDHLVRLVDDLLDVSRITRGKVELRREPLDVAEVVRNAVETISAAVTDGERVLDVDLPSVPLPVEGDPVRLVQVVSNLLHNAVKFTSPGGRIRVRAAREAEEVRVSFADDGAGIPAELLPHVFDPFRQARNVGAQGLGIGLTLVRRIVELHGGRVAAQSEGAGQGAEFILNLPLGASALAPEEASAPGHVANVEPRALVVDDNRDTADSLGMLLETMGMDVRATYDGAAALEALALDAADVVFLDIGMPDMDGHEVARRMRDACGRGITLVAITGGGQEEDRMRTQAAGFDHHLVKPVDLDSVRSVLSGSSDKNSAHG